MTHKPWIRISAVVAVLALCLSLPRLFPIFALASTADDPHEFSEDNMAPGDSGKEEGVGLPPDPQQPPRDDDGFPPYTQPPHEGDDPTTGTQEPEEGGNDTTSDSQGQAGNDNTTTDGPQEPGVGDNTTTDGPQEPGAGDNTTTDGPQEPGAGNEDPTPDPQQPGADGDDILPEPDGAGDDTASDDFNEGGDPPAGPDEGDKEPEGPGEEATEPPEEEPEEPLPPGVSDPTRSSRTVSGYNVFEVDSYAGLTAALSKTSYPSEEFPETSVYILLTGNVTIEAEFTLHQSIDKVVIDGDNQHTLTEVVFVPTQVSTRTEEVAFKDLTIIGYQYYGLFYNPHNTDVRYIYERVTYTGPQILWAPNSNAQFTDCDIHITGAGNVAHEVAEIRDVLIHGDNQFRHNSTFAVFFLYNGGSLVLSHDATLHINATGANDYILLPGDPQSALRLEDRASLCIEGTSRQLATNAGLHSIYLGESAEFEWKAHLPGADYIAVNNSGGAKDAIYLSEGAAFRVAPNGTPTSRLIRINGGNVVVGPGASLSLRSVLYSAPSEKAPFHLAAGSSLTIGNFATFTMEIGNRNNLGAGLLYFGGGKQSGFFVESNATVLIRGNKVSGAVYFNTSASSMIVTDPDYLEIVTSSGSPIYFNSADVANPSTLTYADVQQINYWGSATDNPYLSGGRPVQRWVAKTGALTITATISGYGNGRLSTEISGDPLDQDWTSTLDAMGFAWSNVRILSVGKIGMEVSSDGNDYQGQITAPTLSAPYSQGMVQLRVGQPKKEKAVSSRVPATPDFHVTPNQTVNVNDEIAVWAEYGYVFHNNPPSTSGGSLSLTVPDRIEFGVVTIALSDTSVPAVGAYSLQVQDPRRSSWQVMASFSGFSNADNALNSTLVVNDVPLQDTPQRIAASVGNETVLLDASLLVPGGTAGVGTYSGNITWTLVDAP